MPRLPSNLHTQANRSRVGSALVQGLNDTVAQGQLPADVSIPLNQGNFNQAFQVADFQGLTVVANNIQGAENYVFGNAMRPPSPAMDAVDAEVQQILNEQQQPGPGPVPGPQPPAQGPPSNGGGFDFGDFFGFIFGPGSPFTPPIGPPGGGPPTGGPPLGGIIDFLPDGIVNILENISDVSELIQNPTISNFLAALDITTANQILDFFGISGDASQLIPPDDPVAGPGPGGPGGPPAPAPGPGPGPGFGGDIQGSLMMELLGDSITSKSGRAILAAMQNGTLQNQGIMFPTPPSETPRGTHYVSPEGYVTVDLAGQKVSVLRPIAKSLLGYKSGSQTELQRLDKLARKFMSARKDVKKLAPKVGLKTNNRKSGPSR